MNQDNFYQIGQNHDDLILDTRQQNYETSLDMVSQGERSLHIYSRNLDGRLLDTTDFIDALRKLAISHKQSRVQVLLSDIEPLVKYGHRIIETARQLSSYIELRNIHKDYSLYNESFFIVDGRALLHRKLADRYEAIANYNAPRQAKELINYFNEVWSHSTQAIDARRLYI